MSQITRINLIVMGLPWNNQDKLNKEDIANTGLLTNKIRIYGSGYIWHISDNKRKFDYNNINVNGETNTDKKYSMVPKSLDE